MKTEVTRTGEGLERSHGGWDLRENLAVSSALTAESNTVPQGNPSGVGL